MRFAVAAAVLLCGAGCATTAPGFAGSDTTPSGRVDTWLGASTRVTTGELGQERLAATSGFAPSAVARVGISRHADLGARVDGTTGGVEGRYAFDVSRSDALVTRLVLGARGFGGLLAQANVARAGRAGAEIPIVLGLDAGGIYQAWLGARAAVGWSWGALSDGGAAWNARTFDLGAMLGLALGFRALAFIAELDVDYELIHETSGSATATRHGVVLTPAFAMRVRW